MATTVTTSIAIQRPIEDVFAFVTDARNNPQWQADSGLQRIEQVPESPVGVGTRITEVWKFMGIESTSMSEVTEYEPNKRFARRTLNNGGPIKEGVMTFEPVSGGTRVTSVMQVQAGGLFTFAEPLLATNLKRGFEATLATLKTLLEGQDAV
jgi:uncharacterized protein YndB with AHSA1/START domain